MIWVDIPDFPGYRINLNSEILSLRYASGPMVLKPWIGTTGYWQVRLRRDGEYVNCKVHALMAKTFLGSPQPGQEVRHLNGNKLDNRVGNLAWGTSAENNQDQVRHGTHHEAARDACDLGHEFTPENTMRRKGRNGNTIRKCKECHRITTARYRAKKKADAQ